MEKYRIENELRKNGQVWHYPQVKRSIFKKWEGLTIHGDICNLGRMGFNSYKEAENCILKRIEFLKELDGKKVKKVTHSYPFGK